MSNLVKHRGKGIGISQETKTKLIEQL